MNDQRRERLHEAAVMALRDFTDAGVPYALYLRKFDWQILYGPDDAHRQLLENHVLDAVAGLGGNVVTVQELQSDSTSYLDPDIAFARRAPALLLRDDEWVSQVKALIADADLIVSECLMLSPAVGAELEYAYRNGSIERIALLLPSPGSIFATLDEEPQVQLVSRAVYEHELNERAFMDSYAVRDLVERMKTIAALPTRQRLALARDRDIKLQQYPVTWTGVVSGYEGAAALQELSDQMGGETDDSWWLRFWWHFRRLSTLIWQVFHAGLPEKDAAARIVDAYLKLGDLQLRFERQGEARVVMRGDLDFAEKCAQSAEALTRRHRISIYNGMVGNLRSSLEQVYAAQEAHPGQVLIRPRTKPLRTSPS